MKTSTVNLVHNLISTTSSKGIIQLRTEDDYYDGRNITLNGSRLLNFGSCSYLGLELDDRIKNAAIEAIKKYGVQFSSSRTYIACTLYAELEELLRRIFKNPVLLSTSVSLGHQGVLPIIIEDNDAVILDQQVHASVQDAVLKLQGRGINVSIIRHNDLDELKNRTEILSKSYNRIWYLVDGIYSMYGDYAPLHEIVELMNSNPKLYLYADDAHGMSWCGEHGNGYVLSQISFHPKMVLATSLNKAFAAGGGAFIFPTEELYQKVKNCGGPFIFSGPHQIPVLGAAIASAKIHLTDEIYDRQDALKQRIAYCHSLLKDYNLPVISSPETPIFFIGLGLLRMGHNMVKRLISDGFYVNIAMFPAVSETCTGIRFTITLHHTLKDIENLVKAIAFHFPLALEEEERTINDIQRAFKKVSSFSFNSLKSHEKVHKPTSKYQIQHCKSIKRIPKELWNNLLGRESTFDWDGICFLEETFKNNKEVHNNWRFHYYIIRDEKNFPVLATYFTIALLKDDMLASKSVSQKIEIERQKDPYYLTSNTMMMGCPMSVGKHLYLDKSNPGWEKAFMLLLDAIWKEQEIYQINLLNLRDFNPEDKELCEFLTNQGFLQISLPDNFSIESPSWKNTDEYLASFTKKYRYNLKQEVFKYEDLYEVKVINDKNDADLERYYSLYKNVAKKGFEISSFDLPIEFFSNMFNFKQWEIIELRLKESRTLVGVNFCYKNGSVYEFLVLGIDYKYLESHSVYKQALWRGISRANKLGLKKVNLGLTASINKKKLGAKANKIVAFIQMKDNFNMNLIEIISKESIHIK